MFVEYFVVFGGWGDCCDFDVGDVVMFVDFESDFCFGCDIEIQYFCWSYDEFVVQQNCFVIFLSYGGSCFECWRQGE